MIVSLADPAEAAAPPVTPATPAVRPAPTAPTTTRADCEPFTVLHVVRNMGGGLATAIVDYVTSVPEARHVVLADLEVGFQTADSFPFSVTHRMPRSFRGAVRAIREAVAECDPDVVHAHSSFAGLYVRAGLRGRLLDRVVYTPHCYAFFRRDVSPLARGLFWLVEAGLTARAPAIAACSPAEVSAAQRLPGARPIYVPNVASLPVPIGLPGASDSPRIARGGRHLVVSVGRMCPQKDPELFLQAALAARAEGLGYDFLWIGGGDRDTEAQFRRHDVPFTGWLPREAALTVLAQADVYLHTAAWEGAPISILEAGALGIPVLGRYTSALDSLGLAPLWVTTEHLLHILRSGFTGASMQHARARTAALLRTHTVQAQRSALLAAYQPGRARARGRELARAAR